MPGSCQAYALFGRIKKQSRMRRGLAPSAVSVRRLNKAEANLTGRMVAIGPEGVTVESRDEALSAIPRRKHLSDDVSAEALLLFDRSRIGRLHWK